MGNDKQIIVRHRQSLYSHPPRLNLLWFPPITNMPIAKGSAHTKECPGEIDKMLT
jgi:hypothetical protein